VPKKLERYKAERVRQGRSFLNGRNGEESPERGRQAHVGGETQPDLWIPEHHTGEHKELEASSRYPQPPRLRSQSLRDHRQGGMIGHAAPPEPGRARLRFVGADLLPVLTELAKAQNLASQKKAHAAVWVKDRSSR
jgi:hypothetical protein